LALVVAAYSAGDKALIAASGKYRSPVLDDGFPDLVRHFWAVQSLRDFCGAFNLYIPHQQLCTSWQQAVLYELTIRLHQYPALLLLSLEPQFFTQGWLGVVASSIYGAALGH
jgi:hypothetical protein